MAWAAKTDGAFERQGRADTWAALEEARAAGKCKFIGVSNYSPALLREMEGYATDCMPCINQLELHPRFSSPSLRTYAEQTGLVLTGYGSGNSVSNRQSLFISGLRVGPATMLISCRTQVAIERSPVVSAIAERLNASAVAVVLRWTLARNVVIIPRTANPDKIVENITVGTCSIASRV